MEAFEIEVSLNGNVEKLIVRPPTIKMRKRAAAKLQRDKNGNVIESTALDASLDVLMACVVRADTGEQRFKVTDREWLEDSIECNSPLDKAMHLLVEEMRPSIDEVEKN